MTLVEQQHSLLLSDLKERDIKAWEIKNGKIPNPYPINQNYIWFLSKPQFMNRVKFGSLCRMRDYFELKKESKC